MTIEAERLESQERLDSRKTLAERNRLGQFATPHALAVEVARSAKSYLRESDYPVHFADPAIGTGSFYSALLTVFESEQIASASGVEIDPPFAQTAQRLWGPYGLQVEEGDFTQERTRNALEQLPNLILTNPPYVRHHHLTQEQKSRLRSLAVRATSLPVNGLAGLYVYYLLIAHAWLQAGGVSAWLIPTEFMDVNYGEVLRRYLTEQVSLLAVHRFNPHEVQFGDALVSSAVIVFRKTKPSADSTVCFTYGGTLLSPTASQQVPLSELRQARKWTGYPQLTPLPVASCDAVLSDFFKVQRGIATGANEFFILPRSEAEGRGIPEQFLTPILPSPRHLKETVIEPDGGGYPRIEPQLALINSTLPEEQLREAAPSLWRYLSTAEASGVLDRYLVRKRQPWYRQEHRQPAPFLCTYMGRGIDEKRPFRFIWNRSRAIVPNVYLMLYPQGALKALLERQPEAAEEVFNFLRGITADDLRTEGRVYGGGLHKIEPSELGRISASALVQQFPELASQPSQPALW